MVHNIVGCLFLRCMRTSVLLTGHLEVSRQQLYGLSRFYYCSRMVNGLTDFYVFCNQICILQQCSNINPYPKGTGLWVMCITVCIGINAAAIVRYWSRRSRIRLKLRWPENILPPAIHEAAVFCPSSRGGLSRGRSDPPRMRSVARFTPIWKTSAPASKFRLTAEFRKLLRSLSGFRNDRKEITAEKVPGIEIDVT